jgi:hypothetical protein
MKEQRRNLQHQELLARREKYLVDRARKQQLEVERARNQPSPMAELRKLEMQDRLQSERAARAQEKLERREAAQQKQTIKREAENKERRAWLEELLRDYDVEGNAPRQFNMSGSRRRVFLTPENIDRQLTAMLMGQTSPIDKWSNRARETQRELEEQHKDAMLGGRMLDIQGPPDTPLSAVQSEVTPAELKADLRAGATAAPIDTAGPEFEDKLRSALSSFSQLRGPASDSQASEPQPGKSAPPTPAEDTEKKD